ncbi:MAG: response regulator [Phycisphaerae bacterium]|jgi:CheY-like chemotaxis protein
MTVLKKVLVVDDDPDILEQIEIVLKANGYDVTLMGSVVNAEEFLTSTQPDLAIVDLMMEQMDSGFVLCHQIKKLYPNMPIILLTAVRASTGLVFDAKTPEAKSWIKADCILDKPVRAEELLHTVRKLLQV